METPKTTPKDFFLYIGAMITLYWSAGALIALLFAIINAVFPDALNYYSDPYSSGIRFAIASLIVIFPICLMLLRAIKREVIGAPEKLTLTIRKWLYAFTIFLTAIAMAADLITLLNTFLGGEITSRFILKVLVVLIVSCLLFWYSLLEIRVKAGAAAIRKEFLYGAPLLVLAAIVYGFAVMGSPMTIRKLRFDEQRVTDLSSLQNQIVFNFWQPKGRLPETLEELYDPISGITPVSDPETFESYEYSNDGKLTFTLCANFALPSSTGVRGTPPPIPNPVFLTKFNEFNEFGGQDWTHGQGRSCFERTIDTELYPVRPKGV